MVIILILLGIWVLSLVIDICAFVTNFYVGFDKDEIRDVFYATPFRMYENTNLNEIGAWIFWILWVIVNPFVLLLLLFSCLFE